MDLTPKILNGAKTVVKAVVTVAKQHECLVYLVLAQASIKMMVVGGVWCGLVWCGVVWWGLVWCGGWKVMWYGVVW